jgi:small subunit ribosomal protein S6
LSQYETLLVTTPDLTEAEETALVAAFAEVVDNGGGTMVVKDRLGRRRLAYPIRKYDDGVYTLFLYDAEAEVPKELERRVRISDKVLRWLTVRHEKHWAAELREKTIRDAEARIQAEEARAAAAEKARAEAERRKAEEAEKAAQAEAAAAAAAEAGESGAEPPAEETPSAEAAQATPAEAAAETSESDGGDAAEAEETTKDAGGES